MDQVQRKLVDLKIDFAFKQLFGRPGNERILIDFLNEVLKLPQGKRITDVTIINSEIYREYEQDKKSILDILVKTSEGSHINVEIQIGNKYNMPGRTLYYCSRIFGSQMEMGKMYGGLKPVIAINLVQYKQFPETDEYHTRFELYDPQAKIVLTDQLQIHFVELAKLLAMWENGEVSLREDRLVRWLLMLEATESAAIMAELEEIAMKDDTIIREAMEKWEELSRDPEMVLIYEQRRRQLIDEQAFVREWEFRVEEAELRAEKAELQAEKAMVQAKEAELQAEKAMVQAKEAELQAEKTIVQRAELIRSMLQEGMDMEKIVRITKGTIEEIQKAAGSS